MKPEELRAWRRAHAVSQQRLGDLLGWPRLRIHRMERGQSAIPRVVELALWALQEQAEARGRRLAMTRPIDRADTFV